MNIVLISGRVGQKVEVKNSAAGQPFAKFSIAVRQYGQEAPMWVDCTAFRNQVEAASKLSPGEGVTIRGRLSINVKTDANNVKKTYTSVIVEGFEYPESSKKSGGSEGTGGSGGYQQRQQPPQRDNYGRGYPQQAPPQQAPRQAPPQAPPQGNYTQQPPQNYPQQGGYPQQDQGFDDPTVCSNDPFADE